MNFEDLIDFEDLVDEEVELSATEEDTASSEPDPVSDQDPTEEDVEPSNDESLDLDLTANYKLLTEYGALEPLEEFDGSPEKFEEALKVTEQKKKEKLANDLWNQLPEDFKPLLSYALNGGKDLNSYLNAYAPLNVTPEDLDANIDLQKQVVKEYYLKTSNHPLDRIERMVSKLEERGHLYDEAVDALTELEEFKAEQQKTLIAKAQQEELARQEALKKEAEDLSNLIDAAAFVEDTRKNRVKSFILAPIKVEGRTTTQFDNALDEVFNNKEHFVQLADLLADYNPKTGFNFERLEKKLKTKTNSAFKTLLEETLTTTHKGNVRKPLNEDFNWNKYFEQ